MGNDLSGVWDVHAGGMMDPQDFDEMEREARSAARVAVFAVIAWVALVAVVVWIFGGGE